MSEVLQLTGKCLCGAVELAAKAKMPGVVICHCDMCRQWSAGPFMSLNCQSVTFDVEEDVCRIRSSDRAERGFCVKCGSNLFYRRITSSDYQVAVGLFDDQSKLRLSLQVFADEKLAYYDLANETKMMTNDDVKAMVHAHDVEVA